MNKEYFFAEIEAKSQDEEAFLRKLSSTQSNGATFAQNLIFYGVSGHDCEPSDIELGFKIDEKDGKFYIHNVRGAANEEFFKQILKIFRGTFRKDNNIFYHRIHIDKYKYDCEAVILRKKGDEEVINLSEAVYRRLDVIKGTTGEEY